MESEKIEFVQFGTKPRDNNLYALDSVGVAWVRVNNIEWESLEEVPRHIQQGLTAGQLMQVMALNKNRSTN